MSDVIKLKHPITVKGDNGAAISCGEMSIY